MYVCFVRALVGRDDLYVVTALYLLSLNMRVMKGCLSPRPKQGSGWICKVIRGGEIDGVFLIGHKWLMPFFVDEKSILHTTWLK